MIHSDLMKELFREEINEYPKNVRQNETLETESRNKRQVEQNSSGAKDKEETEKIEDN